MIRSLLVAAVLVGGRAWVACRSRPRRSGTSARYLRRCGRM